MDCRYSMDTSWTEWINIQHNDNCFSSPDISGPVGAKRWTSKIYKNFKLFSSILNESLRLSMAMGEKGGGVSNNEHAAGGRLVIEHLQVVARHHGLVHLNVVRTSNTWRLIDHSFSLILALSISIYMSKSLNPHLDFGLWSSFVCNHLWKKRYTFANHNTIDNTSLGSTTRSYNITWKEARVSSRAINCWPSYEKIWESADDNKKRRKI